MDYQNKQTGTALLFVTVSIAVIILVLAPDSRDYVLWPAIITLGLVSFLFHSLNIKVSDNEINWSFGPGFWKKTLKITDIKSVRVINTKWYYGLGIRYIPSGWLYTVSGTTAVQLELNDGTKINLGTNDSENLVNVIESKLTH
ncbi:MAG: hypothetical protein HWE27_04210 [Gammaproteobacteria bacterium]|nr:hypothetical protein [Gammaproteobacteria bacterium]